jgi:hypothetical protein
MTRDEPSTMELGDLCPSPAGDPRSVMTSCLQLPA